MRFSQNRFHFFPVHGRLLLLVDFWGVEEVIVPRVKGKDATAVEAIWRDLWDFTMTYGRGGVACMAMSMGTGDNRALNVLGAWPLRTTPRTGTNSNGSHFKKRMDAAPDAGTRQS